MKKSKKSKMPKYSLLLQWGEEEQSYVVIFPEWHGRVVMPFTDGKTFKQAAKKAKSALEALVAFALEDGEALPEPHIWHSSLPDNSE